MTANPSFSWKRLGCLAGGTPPLPPKSDLPYGWATPNQSHGVVYKLSKFPFLPEQKTLTYTDVCV